MIFGSVVSLYPFVLGAPGPPVTPPAAAGGEEKMAQFHPQFVKLGCEIEGGRMADSTSRF
jgi:hypothetical protein